MANFNNMQPISGYDDYGMEDIDMEMDKFFGKPHQDMGQKNTS